MSVTEQAVQSSLARGENRDYVGPLRCHAHSNCSVLVEWGINTH